MSATIAKQSIISVENNLRIFVSATIDVKYLHFYSIENLTPLDWHYITNTINYLNVVNYHVQT